jgi:hypothetical protein
MANVAKLQFSLGNWLNRDCTYLGRLAVEAPRFSSVARNICESYGWNTLHATRLAPTILRGFLHRGIYVVFLGPSKEGRHSLLIEAVMPSYTGVLISPVPDQEGNKLGSMPRTRAISTHRDASCHQVIFPVRQGAEENSRHSDKNISLFPSWSG